MKFIIFFICVPFVYSEIHSFITSYTGIRGQTTAGIPEFFAVSTLDGDQIDYYDSDTMKMIHKQDWMKDYAKDMWTEDTEIRKHVHQIYKNNIHALMQRFNQSDGLHTYQRMYGCDYDDKTGDSDGFDQYGYDGEDFISLDLKESRYITPVQQGLPTVQKWNNDRKQLRYLKQYYKHECVYWLRYFLKLRKGDLERRAPEVFLLQKSPSSPVVCHVTGFYPSGVTISWLRKGQDHDEDVDIGELRPNEDGTFQKSSTLHVPPDEWENNQYTCVVEHQEKTIQRNLTEEIKSNYTQHFTILVFLMGVLIVLPTVFCIIYKKRMSRYKGFKSLSRDSEDGIYIDKAL